MKYFTFNRAVLFSLVSFTLAVASPASASDSKTYSGTECVAKVPLDHSDDIFYNSSGHSTNIGNNAITVLCPAVRDTSGPISAEIRVLDTNRTSDIACQLVSVARKGFVLARLSDSSKDTSNTFVPLTFGFHTAGLGFATAERNSTIFISCDLPATDGGASSGIAGYIITEHGN